MWRTAISQLIDRSIRDGLVWNLGRVVKTSAVDSLLNFGCK